MISANIFAAAPSESLDTKKPEKVYPNTYYYKQFQEVFERIEKDYVQDPERQEMTDEAINGMLRSLDPYSAYYTGDDLEFFLSSTEGEFGGIGVEIIYDNGAVKVISPIDDLPAYKVGIRAGDYIVGVNGELVSNMGFNKAVKEMRGEPGTKLNLLILKEDENIPKEVEVTREIVKIKPIKYELEQDELGGIAYLRITAFNKNTVNELKKAVRELEKKSKANNKELRGIILDVRNNPGGLLDQAAYVSEYFLDHGVIVSIQGKKSEDNATISAGRFVPKAPNVPMVVLINSGSASASEIVAGALQDHKRAIIVGTTSFGKGLVQTFTKINKRAGVKLTTAKYLTPNGRSINAKGIQPDIFIDNAKVEFSAKEDKDNPFTKSSVKSYLKKYNNEEKFEQNDKKLKEIEKNKLPAKTEHEMSDKYKEDYQYARAYDLIRGLIITKYKN
jgi:carboxyl-terminal processing protease